MTEIDLKFTKKNNTSLFTALQTISIYSIRNDTRIDIHVLVG